MNEGLAQAGIRLLIVFITAGLGALGANLTILQEAVDDPIMASAVVAIATAVINAILKYLGGPTEPMPAADSGVRAAAPKKRPNWFAI